MLLCLLMAGATEDKDPWSKRTWTCTLPLCSSVTGCWSQ